jgi:hypothetical protein
MAALEKSGHCLGRSVRTALKFHHRFGALSNVGGTPSIGRLKVRNVAKTVTVSVLFPDGIIVGTRLLAVQNI